MNGLLRKWLDEQHEKMFDLVWYASKPRDGRGNPVTPREMQDFYAEQDEKHGIKRRRTPVELCENSINKMNKVKAKYFDEVNELNGEDGSWHHGFNSGVLATIRLLDDATHPWIPGVDGEEDPRTDDERAEDAIREFPFLDL